VLSIFSLIRNYPWLVVVFFMSISISTYAKTSDDTKTVLVLSPDARMTTYLENFYTTLDESLQSRLGKKSQLVLLHENLDLSNFQDQKYQDSLAFWLKEKYRNHKVDAIIVVGHNSLKFLLAYNKRLWPSVPIVFTLASDIEVTHMSVPATMNGTVIRANFSNVVNAAKTLLPTTTQIVLLGDMPASEMNKTFSSSTLARMSDGLNILDLRGHAREEVKEKVGNLGSNSVIYMEMLTDDLATGKIYGRDLFDEVKDIATCPILVDDPREIGKGALAALTFNYHELATDAAELTQDIFNGHNQNKRELISVGYAPILDHAQVERWRVNPENFPSGSEQRFYSPSLWQSYHQQIIAVVALIILLMVVIGLLILERRWHGKAVNVSRRLLGQITLMNREMTTSIYKEAIGHELAQPLAAILSNVEAAQIFLKRDAPPLDLVRDTLANIRRDNLRANDVMKNMQGLLTKSDNKLDSVDINVLVRKVLSFLSIEAKIRRIHIKQELAPEPMLASINIAQMQQVMVNLLLNSMDAIDRRKGKERRITVETMLYGNGSIRVSVTDTGTGFDEGVERIFDSFFTTKPEGVGLGLWITASIVQAHGGHIWAENRIGGGIVRFKLPLLSSETI